MLSIYMPIPSHFSRHWLISTVFEIGQNSEKIVMFLQVGTGEDLNRPGMVSGTLEGSQETGWELGWLQEWWYRTWDNKHSFCRKSAIFSFSFLQENIFFVYVWEGIMQGNGCCCTSHRDLFWGSEKDGFPDEVLWFWRCSSGPVSWGGRDLSPSGYVAMGHNSVQILFLCFCPFILFLWRKGCFRERIHLTEDL